MQDSFYSRQELQAMGFAALGEQVFVSRRASIYNPGQISLASHVRIDDFSIITARKPVVIGSYTHISAHSAIYGAAGFRSGSFVTISGRVAIYTESDDFSGASLTNPLCPSKFKPGYKSAPVELADHVIIGTCSTVLPGVILQEGVAVAAHSLVNRGWEAWFMVGGVPAQFLKPRRQDAKRLAEQFLAGSKS